MWRRHAINHLLQIHAHDDFTVIYDPGCLEAYLPVHMLGQVVAGNIRELQCIVSLRLSGVRNHGFQNPRAVALIDVFLRNQDSPYIQDPGSLFFAGHDECDELLTDIDRERSDNLLISIQPRFGQRKHYRSHIVFRLGAFEFKNLRKVRMVNGRESQNIIRLVLCHGMKTSIQPQTIRTDIQEDMCTPPTPPVNRGGDAMLLR